MKRLLAYLFLVLVLIFSLQSWTKADDISEFEIEGMSIGDSLLDYFDLADMNNFYIPRYPSSDDYKGNEIPKFVLQNSFISALLPGS